jgi:Na+/H+-translocating membrane pyrophosphatase
MGIFIVVFSCIVFVFVDLMGSTDGTISFFATISYIIGALVSMLCGYIGMKIATMSNYRTTYMATESLQEAFKVAFRAGCVMGFGTVSLGLGVLTVLFVVYV